MIDPLRVPADFWDREPVTTALAARDFQELFKLLQKYHGASQTKIAAACDLTQSAVSKIINGHHQPTVYDVIHRIATGLHMTDQARLTLGLAPASRSPSNRHPDPTTRHTESVAPTPHPADPSPRTASSPRTVRPTDHPDPIELHKDQDVNRRTLMTNAAAGVAFISVPRSLLWIAAHNSAQLSGSTQLLGLGVNALDFHRDDLRRLATDYVMTSDLSRILTECLTIV